MLKEKDLKGFKKNDLFSDLIEAMNLTPLKSVKSFYLLEYFYVLLKSVEKYSDEPKIFESFKALKQEHRLGESKYKKLTWDHDRNILSKLQEDRYQKTFKEVLEESQEYNLIENVNDYWRLTEEGRKLLTRYQSEGTLPFNRALFKLMEAKYQAFRQLVTLFYKANKYQPGLLIFPSYSPRLLDLEKPAIKTTADIIQYSKLLVNRLQQDIQKYLGESRNLQKENDELLARLTESKLLPANLNDKFDPKEYHSIISKFRNFWRIYFLREIYQYESIMFSFDRWIYRGKQIGVIHATDFYPYFHGKIVYPISVITKATASKDFQKLYDYPDDIGFYVHHPIVEDNDNQNKFVDGLVKAYFGLRRSNRSYFVNLLAVRELVCYNLKIPEYLFDQFLEEAYKLNLRGQLNIGISLEVDRLPEETQALYLAQEPVMVEGKYRNIIAIEVGKRGNSR